LSSELCSDSHAASVRYTTGRSRTFGDLLIHVDVTTAAAAARDGKADVSAVPVETIRAFIAAMTVGTVLHWFALALTYRWSGHSWLQSFGLDSTLSAHAAYYWDAAARRNQHECESNSGCRIPRESHSQAAGQVVPAPRRTFVYSLMPERNVPRGMADAVQPERAKRGAGRDCSGSAARTNAGSRRSCA
jgi:hypothetical protein